MIVHEAVVVRFTIDEGERSFVIARLGSLTYNTRKEIEGTYVMIEASSLGFFGCCDERISDPTVGNWFDARPSMLYRLVMICSGPVWSRPLENEPS